MEQGLQPVAKILRLEALGGSSDLVRSPPAVIEREALLALVEAGSIDLARPRAAEKEALAMQHLAVAPLHDAFALPHPADLARHREAGLLARFADSGVVVLLAGIDQP